MSNDIDRVKVLEELAEEVKNCTRCAISQYRTKAVFGEGDPYSKIMFIGEAPGKTEDETGRPFVGNAGKFLDTMLNAAGFSRENVYITNVIKTRPPENRDPQPDEIANCRCYLDRQIEIIDPKIIVTLGRYSMGLFLPGVTISKVHGVPYMKNGRVYMPMYHPAATLHQPGLREVAIADMLKLPKLITLLENGTVKVRKSDGSTVAENSHVTHEAETPAEKAETPAVEMKQEEPGENVAPQATEPVQEKTEHKKERTDDGTYQLSLFDF
jgi:DNA polymerase